MSYSTQEIQEHAPLLLPGIDFSNCRHEILWRNGHAPKRGGRQIFKCGKCGAQFLEGSRSKDRYAEELVRAGKMLLSPGATLRFVRPETSLSLSTVHKVARLISGKRPNCPCGRTAGHRGLCRWRRTRI
jgi:transposase-like protein